jgi:hypothetical protein
MAIVSVIADGTGMLIQAIMMWPPGGFRKAVEADDDDFDKDGEEIGTILGELNPQGSAAAPAPAK